MKTQGELNQKHQMLVKICEELVVRLDAGLGKQLVDKALVAVVGRSTGSYGDTGMARNARIAREAQADLIAALKSVVENSRPQKQIIDDEKLSKVREKCHESQGSFTYEVLVGGQHVADFKANSLKAAKAFGKSLRLGKHEVKRLTQREQRARQVVYATSPESEAYWCS